MVRTRRLPVVLVLAAGAACKQPSPPAPEPDPAVAARLNDAALPSPGDSDRDDAPPVAVAGLPVIGGDRSFVLADKPGATVALAADGGATTQLGDGAVVTQLEMPDGDARDRGDDAVIYVDAAGTRGMVPARNLVSVDLIHPGTTPGWAIVRPQDSCSADDCYQDVWLVDGLRARWKLADNTVDATFAWHPRGTGLAIGVDTGIVIVELPAGKVTGRHRTYVAPAYAPDGTLYVRTLDSGVWTLAAGRGGKATQVHQGTQPIKRDPAAKRFAPPPVEFAPDGSWRLSEDELAGNPE